MRRRFFWALVAVAVVTVLIGSVTAAFLIGREVDRSTRDEFRRQAQATAQLLDLADTRPPGQGNRPGFDAVGILAIVTQVGGHDYVEAAIVTNNGVEVLGAGGPLLAAIPGESSRSAGRSSSRRRSTAPRWRRTRSRSISASGAT